MDRLPPAGLARLRERSAKPVTDTRESNPGEVWEENEFWIDLTWRIDPDGRWESGSSSSRSERAGEKLTVDEYYGCIFDNSVPGLPERRRTKTLYAAGVHAAVRRVRDRQTRSAAATSRKCRATISKTSVKNHSGVSTHGLPKPPTTKSCRRRRRNPTRRVGAGRRRRRRGDLAGWPTPSGTLEFCSSTLVAWGWHDSPSHLHEEPRASGHLDADEMPLISTFRLPVHIHTRSANAKWLDEIAHTNPLWLHPTNATAIGVGTGDLVRVETEIGHFVVKAWVTEGSDPACGVQPPHGTMEVD